MPIETRQDTVHARTIEKAFIENHELVFRTAFRITGNASDAEDVLQTLFLRLIRREPKPDAEMDWGAYLRRAAVNAALDVIRRRKHRMPLEDAGASIPENRPDPYREYSASELGAWLREAIAGLSPAAAQMFVLRHVEGYDNRAIARMLGTTQGTVAVTLFRTRSRLRKSIRKFFGGNERTAK